MVTHRTSHRESLQRLRATTATELHHEPRRSPRNARQAIPKASPGARPELRVSQDNISSPIEPLEPDGEEHAQHPNQRQSTPEPTGTPCQEHPENLDPTPLTKRALRLLDRLARKGQKKVSDFPTDTSTDASNSRVSTSVITTTHPDFPGKAAVNGVLPWVQSTRAINVKSIRQRFDEPRSTPSPTASDFERYIFEAAESTNEMTTAGLIRNYLVKDYTRPYRSTLDQPLSGLPKDQGFNNGLSEPRPDFIAGPTLRNFTKYPILGRVDGAAVVKGNPNSLVVPHIAGQFKGFGKDMRQAEAQSAYDGAALVYGRNRVLDAIGKTDPDGHAKITTFTTDGTHLRLFANHATRSDHGKTEYHQSQVKMYDLVTSHDDYREAYRGFRNAQDMAREAALQLGDDLDNSSPTIVTTSAEDQEHAETFGLELGEGEAAPLSEPLSPAAGETTPSLPQSQDRDACQGKKRKATSAPSSLQQSARCDAPAVKCTTGARGGGRAKKRKVP